MHFKKPSTLLLVFTALLITLPLPGQGQTLSPPQKGTITNVKTYANLRVAPKIKSPSIIQIPLGSQVEILEIKISSQDTGKWRATYPLWVRARFQGRVGFIAAALVRLDGQSPSTGPAPSSPALPSVNLQYSLKKTQYHSLYYKWGKHYGIDWRLLKAIAIVESSERAHLVNKFGYTGLFQIGDSVLQGFNKKAGTTWTKPSLKDPGRNTRIGAWLTSRNINVLARPEVFGAQFLSDPVNLAVAIYCAHNYGIGLVKKTVMDHRTQKKPMTFQKVFDAIEEAGKKRYGNKAGEAKMKVAKKVGAYYLGLRQKLGYQP